MTPESETTPAQQPAETAKEQTSQKDHTYTLDGDTVKIKTIKGEEYEITLDLPEGFKAEVSESEGDNYVAIYDEYGRKQAYVELTDEETIDYNYVKGGDEDKYEVSYADGIFKMVEKTLPVTEGNQETESTADSTPNTSLDETKTVREKVNTGLTNLGAGT